MTKKENLLALLRREPFEEIPAEFNMCPSLVEEYQKKNGFFAGLSPVLWDALGECGGYPSEV